MKLNLKKELLRRDGSWRYAERQTLYTSPLDDIASSFKHARSTVEACGEILENSALDIRLLSKSPLIGYIAQQLAGYKDRLIFGLSTGTADDHLAKAIEPDAPPVSQRFKTLRRLQRDGFRTFGMICPVLPQHDFDAFAERVLEQINAGNCEHVWVEALNVRGQSMSRTTMGLINAGYAEEAKLLAHVSKMKPAWEAYSRSLFLAFAERLPGHQLKFLQYVRPGQADWWRAQKSRGAVLLGKHA